jgi:hypothetical protein
MAGDGFGSWNDRARRVRLVLVAILALGWGAAVTVYVRAPAVEDNPDLQQMKESKKYLRELERMGGKMVVLTTDIDDWLASLWEGKARAYTIAALTVAAAGAYVLAERVAARIADEDGERPRDA